MDCIFCKIAEGSVPSNKVYEDERVLAFHDINPVAPVHILVIPKKHIPSLNDVESGDWGLIGELLRVSRQLAQQTGIDASGFRIVNNCGKDGGQEVFHLHFHLIGGTKLGPIISRER